MRGILDLSRMQQNLVQLFKIFFVL